MSKRLTFLLLLCAILFLPTLALTPFYTRGEPREALVAQAMLDSDNWVLPRSSYNQAVPSKPPLMHWMIATFSSLSGEVSELTARLPSALSALLFAALFYLFLGKRNGEQLAWLATLILFSTVEWARAVTAARVDMLLSVCLGLALLELYRWHERDLRGVSVLAILALAGATLTKGPVALILPAGIFGLFLLLRGISFWRASFKVTLVIAPALLLAGLWYLAAYRQDAAAFWDKVYAENIARFTSSMEDSPHEHTVFYLAGVFALGLCPWTLLLLARALQTIRSWRSALVWPRSDLILYALITVAAFFVFYAIPASKRSVYLLPCYPFAALLIAHLFLALEESNQLRRAVKPILVTTHTIIGIVNLVGLPLYAKQLSANDFSIQVRELTQGRKLYSYSYNHFQIAFYSRLPITEIASAEMLTEGDMVLAAAKKLEALKTNLPSDYTLTTVATAPNDIEKRGNSVLLLKVTPALE